MSEKAAKASRREVRRSLGPSVADLIQAHHAQIGHMAQQIELQEAERRMERYSVSQLSDNLVAFTGRTLRERLRWLLTGQ